MSYEYGPYKKSSIKLNYNCPESEKTGSGPGSCSGSSGNIKVEKDIEKSLDLAQDVIRDFANTRWKKPSDLDIEARGLNIAVDKFKLSGDDAKRYVEEYKKSYNDTWRQLIGKENREVPEDYGISVGRKTRPSKETKETKQRKTRGIFI